MTSINSFAPIANRSARILILGSMPGELSLKSNQYYAHPRNAFWPIMASLYGFSATSNYESRTESLKTSGIALWDVLHSCIRVGSLDSAIEKGSRVPNDFQSFFQQHTHIKLVAFNGTEAEKSFNTYVLPGLQLNNLRFVRLPSSSPAHAVSFDKKIAAWRSGLSV
jgi:double-stranded uracil-DNA glycosylase